MRLLLQQIFDRSCKRSKGQVLQIEVLDNLIRGKFRLLKGSYVSNISLEVAESCYKRALSILRANGNFGKDFYIEVSSSFSVYGDYQNLKLYCCGECYFQKGDNK
jgi:hypothetical protein